MHDCIECSGAPRDQGLDQGLCFRGAVRDRVARAGVRARPRRRFSLRPFASGPTLGSGAGRAVIRHYTHLAERMEGIALGADLPLESVMELVAHRPEALSSPACSVAARGAGSVRLGRVLPRSPAPGSRWIVRRSRPEVGFASLEVTLPWLASAVAGVNEHGVAAVLAPRSQPLFASLLVQEALQRFGDLESALDWCVKRPTEGDGIVLLADASGESAAVELGAAAGEARVLRADSGFWVDGVEASLEARLRKELEEAGAGDSDALEAQLVAALAETDADAAQVWLDPAARSLALHPAEPPADAERMFV